MWFVQADVLSDPDKSRHMAIKTLLTIKIVNNQNLDLNPTA